ncbi:MAG: polysaccharide pyruvyl transferase family protein [Candidatus Aureabacteria bacterium]|nr:polysaccharide pyruvyl transferase family protein [Candidatus Auribacterota bacterium]
MHEINQYGSGVIVGGGNLYENGELEINSTALKALDVPLMIFSVSRGRIYNRDLNLVDRTDVMTDDKIRILNKKADITLSRDITTQKYLESLDIYNLLGGCPTLYLNEIPQHLMPISDVGKTDALISVRTPALMNIPLEYQYALREQIREIISYLKGNGYKVIKLFCHDHRDIAFAASFKDMEYIYSDDIYTYISYLRSTRLNVTFRLHSFLPALSYDIPAIKISYDERAFSLTKTIGMGEWNIDMVKQDMVEEVKKRVQSLNDFEIMKENAKKTTWKKLKDVQLNSFKQFADLVHKRTGK